ncbi:MAG TPA: hypothetical protein VEC08_05765, partial [Nitrososphaerales archaeon]|nr:hypothetical protein [Nitrososphaerales archaeon]
MVSEFSSRCGRDSEDRLPFIFLDALVGLHVSHANDFEGSHVTLRAHPKNPSVSQVFSISPIASSPKPPMQSRSSRFGALHQPEVEATAAIVVRAAVSAMTFAALEVKAWMTHDVTTDYEGEVWPGQSLGTKRCERHLTS